MRNLILWLALCAGLIATPAFARDGAMYIGGEFGAMIVEDMNVDVGATENAITLNHEYGYDGGIFVGYDFGAFRLEAEAAYKKADLDDYQTTIRLPLEAPNFAASREAGGSSSALSFMINGMLDFGDDDGISGFVGGGVGMARVKVNNATNFANATPFLDGSDTKLAWQVFAGVRQAISDHIDVTVKYRFFNASKVEMTAFNGAATEHRFRSHSLLGGLTFNFGKVDPPTKWCESLKRNILRTEICPTDTPDIDRCPDERQWNEVTQRCECPDPERPEWNADTKRCEKTIVEPKPCPQGTYQVQDRPDLCGSGPALVHFGWNEREFAKPEKYAAGSQEEADARRLLQTQNEEIEEAYRAFESFGTVQIIIEGHADRSGPDSYNDPLSRDRAVYVRQKLIDRGLPPSAFAEPEWAGERENRKPTADGVREQQNRRVEILFRGQGK